MHPRTALAIARKDAIDILLNKTTIFVLIMPILLAILFLVMSNLISAHTTNILVYNPDQSRIVQVVSSAFDKAHVTEADSPADVTAAFGPNGTSKDATYDVGLIVPANFESALHAGQHPQVSLYVNGTNINAQNSLALQTLIVNYARQIASPQAPLALSTATINPPSTANVGDLIATLYSAVSLMVSFMVGISLMPGLLIEEKERKTLRMLMVTPASFADVIVGKLLVALGYQLVLSLVVLGIQGGFTGQIPLVLLYTLLGSCMSLALGLLLGGVFQTASTAGAVSGTLIIFYILPGIFSGPMGSILGSNPVAQAMKVLPTYYLSDGAYNAMQSQGSFGGNLLDIGVILATTLVLVAITAWVLRRQASVVASI